MTGLWVDVEPCGCEHSQGHTCDPPFGRPYPWEHPAAQCDAMLVAGAIRVNPAAQIEALHGWDRDRLTAALITAAAMVDVDRRPSQLLDWAPSDPVLCRRGLHPLDPDNTIRTSNGRRRCRACLTAWRHARKAVNT